LAVYRKQDRPFSSEGYRIGLLWNDSDTRGCGRSGYHGYLKACWPEIPMQEEVRIMNPLFVGIDVSSRNNVAYLMNPDGSKHSSFSVQNNLGGAKLLSERIVSALSSMQLEHVVIGLEATSIYGDSLVYALREDGRLGRFQRKIHVLNPKQVKKFKEAYPDLPKNDFVDAFVIADHLRFGRIARAVYMDDYRYQALRTLTRARFDVIQNLTWEKQRFANYLFLKCSGMAQDKDIQNTSATTIALMERFETVDDLANANLDELTAFLEEKGRNFADPATKAKAIQVAARNSYRLPSTLNNSVNQAMSVSIASMRALEKQVKILDKAIEQQFEIIPNPLTSIPGIGKVYSAGIIAEIGDIHRFDSQASIAKFAGLVWTQHQSGDFEAEHSQMIKTGNRYLRYYLLEAANSVRRCDSEFRRYYDLKFKEVNRFQHKRALALTARKLVRLVFRLLKDNRLYIPPEG
jgi:transposase